MRISEIEAWTIRVVDLIHANAPNEDARIELKAEWPDPMKAARRIAGHANAARGENILWIIGVDEKRGLVGASPEDMANWYPRVQKYFDGVAPALTDVNVPLNGSVVVALLFETSRAPFVVRGSTPEIMEVPWREGTRVRSANRTDLLRILVPQQRLPMIEILHGRVEASLTRDEANQTVQGWRFNFAVYIVPLSAERTVIPFHRNSLRFAISDTDVIGESESLRLEPELNVGDYERGKYSSRTLYATPSEVLIDGPGLLYVTAYAETPVVEGRPSADVTFEAEFLPALADVPALVSGRMIAAHKPNEGRLIWGYTAEIAAPAPEVES